MMTGPGRQAGCHIWCAKMPDRADPRFQSRTGRALLHLALSDHTSIPLDDLQLELSAAGKPFIRAPDSLRDISFSISHTSRFAACAVATGLAVGIDVQSMERPRDVAGLADRYFSRQEAEALRAMCPIRAREAFFVLWTLKEAFAKAHGLGLFIPLSQVTIRLDGDLRPAGLELDPCLEEDSSAWQLGRAWATSDHALAFALRRGGGSDLPVFVHEVDLDGRAIGGPGSVSEVASEAPSG